MNRTVYICGGTGREQVNLSSPGADVAHAYFTANCWTEDGGIVLARMKDRRQSHACELVLVNPGTGDEQVLTDKASWEMYAVQDGYAYHLTDSGIYRTALSDGRTHLLWTGDERFKLQGPPSLTRDGRYISVYWRLDNGQTSINRFDLHTGRMEEFCRKVFAPPFDVANHCMLNPQNGNLMFFSHEGTCQYITNRLWLADYEIHSSRSLFKQRLDSDGGNGEPCGHEMWAPDGRGIYFIKYVCATIPPKGIWYYNLEKDEASPVASGYKYWHVAVSPLGDALASDTQIGGDTSEVVFIRPDAGIEKVVAHVRTDWTHPCHPHPQFSPDSRYICYTFLGEDGRTAVGITEVPD